MSLTKREAFAMSALQGLLANDGMGDADLHETSAEWRESISEAAVEFADATIAILQNSVGAVPDPVHELWECLGRWSAYLVTNGHGADREPPSWLIEAVNKATRREYRLQSKFADTTPAAWPCEILQADFENNTITLKVQCPNYHISVGQYWLSTSRFESGGEQ
jgi:hypothetical protein